jgi:hypothetical protein
MRSRCITGLQFSKLIGTCNIGDSTGLRHRSGG